jgi:hypothetical protein
MNNKKMHQRVISREWRVRHPLYTIYIKVYFAVVLEGDRDIIAQKYIYIFSVEKVKSE